MNLLKKIYYNKWFPRLFYIKPDGGKESGVTGYFLIEWKAFFSIGILHFKEGSREAFHSHAFNAFTFWLKGEVTEVKYPSKESKRFSAGLKPKYTPRTNCHKVVAHKDTYALTFRGPWVDFWREVRKDAHVVLTHGRRVIGRVAE